MKYNNYRELFPYVDMQIKVEDKYITPINFDNGATTPPIGVAIESILKNSAIYGPISKGSGQKGELCTKKYENARNYILKFFNLENTNTHDVVYTKNTTESLNLLANALIKDKSEKVLTTRMEHHANDLPWRYSCDVDYVEVDELGRIKIEDIERKLIENKGKIKYVSITGAANTTGYVNDINQIAVICHKYSAKIIVDAAQLVAHKEINMKGKNKNEQIDFLVFSAHKIYAPFGSGIVVGLKEELNDSNIFLKGGGCVDIVSDNNVIYSDSPKREEAGTANFLGVMALVSSLKKLKEIGFENIYNHEMDIKKYLINEMKQIKEVTLYGDSDFIDDRLGVITFNVDGIEFDELAHIFANEYGISLRYGKFCAHPYVNRLLKISDENAYFCAINSKKVGMVRLSLGLYNTMDEAIEFIKALKKIIYKNKI